MLATEPFLIHASMYSLWTGCCDILDYVIQLFVDAPMVT